MGQVYLTTHSHKLIALLRSNVMHIILTLNKRKINQNYEERIDFRIGVCVCVCVYSMTGNFGILYLKLIKMKIF